MGRPPRKEYHLSEQLQKIKAAGIKRGIKQTKPNEEEILLSLDERIKKMLLIFKNRALKATEMVYFVMYDIENNKVRNRIAKFLEKKGCIRIQKSVFLARSDNKRFQEIYEALRDVQSYYENNDSILLVPANTSDIRSMKIIGKLLNISLITDKPGTIFF